MSSVDGGCPICGTMTTIISGVVGDPDGDNDEYFCSECLVGWPTEWNKNYDAFISRVRTWVESRTSSTYKGT